MLGESMISIVGWHLNDEKIILSIMSEGSTEPIDVELPQDMFKEMVIEGPPSEELKIRENIDEIHNVIKKQILTIEEMDKLAKDFTKEAEDIRTAAMGASERIEVQRLSVALRAVDSKRGALAQRRYLCKLLYQKEGELRAKLLRKLRG